MKDDNNKFSYTYVAPTENERREIESIRRQYVAQDVSADELARLRALDAKVKNPPKVLGIVLGVVGVLIFGLGLTMVLEWYIVIWGVVVSAVGAIPLSAAYPSYRLFLKRNKKKYGEEIVRLSEKLLNENGDKTDG